MAHAEALRRADPESQMARQFGDDYRNSGLTPKQVAMLEFVEHLTFSPSTITNAFHNELREYGWMDADIVDMVHITALYSFMVRIADGLGVEMEAGRGWEPVAERLPFKDEITQKTFKNIVTLRD